MLEGIKRLFTGSASGPAEGWEGIAPWAASKQYTFRGVHEEGFVVDGRLGATPWRLEWGPPQRSYIKTRELRMRMELSLRQDPAMMVLSRSLLDLLEQETFDDFTQGTQTYVGSSVPEEMRWLAMWGRNSLKPLPPTVK